MAPYGNSGLGLSTNLPDFGATQKAMSGVLFRIRVISPTASSRLVKEFP
jgi:hypothetical protein